MAYTPQTAVFHRALDASGTVLTMRAFKRLSDNYGLDVYQIKRHAHPYTVYVTRIFPTALLRSGHKLDKRLSLNR